MKYKQIFHQLLELSRVIGNQWQTVPPLIWHTPNQEELSTSVEMQDRWRKPRSHTTILEGFGDATLLPSNWIRVFLEEKWWYPCSGPGGAERPSGRAKAHLQSVKSLSCLWEWSGFKQQIHSWHIRSLRLGEKGKKGRSQEAGEGEAVWAAGSVCCKASHPHGLWLLPSLFMPLNCKECFPLDYEDTGVQAGSTLVISCY